MNLSTVNTVNELVEQNNTATPPSTSQLDALVENLNLIETYELALSVIQRLGTFHQSVIEDLKEEEATDLDRFVVWVADEQKLHTAWNLVNEVSEAD